MAIKESFFKKIERKYGPESGRGGKDRLGAILTTMATSVNSFYCALLYLFNLIMLIYWLYEGVNFLFEQTDEMSADNPYTLLLALLLFLVIIVMLLALFIALFSCVPNICAVIFTRYRIAVGAFLFNYLGLIIIFIAGLIICSLADILKTSPLVIPVFLISSTVNLLLLVVFTLAAAGRYAFCKIKEGVKG